MVEFYSRKITYPKGKPQEWQNQIIHGYVYQMIRIAQNRSLCLAIAATKKSGKTTFSFMTVKEMFEYAVIKEKCGDERFDILLKVPYEEDVADYAYRLCKYLKEHLSEKYGVVSLDIMSDTIHVDSSNVTVWVRSSALCLMSHEFGGIVVDDAHETNSTALWEIMEYTYSNCVPSVLIGGITRKRGYLEKNVWSLILNNPSVKTFVVGRAMPQSY